jgi:hypothetical protein
MQLPPGWSLTEFLAQGLEQLVAIHSHGWHVYVFCDVMSMLFLNGRFNKTLASDTICFNDKYCL